jgi:hypothetical protein
MNLRLITFTGSALAFLAVHAQTTMAQGTAFTYQGSLTDGAAPASGSYDLRFAIYDAVNPIAGPLTNSGVTVSNGLFTTQLDFGAGVFDGSPRWLEIGVRTNGGGSFTTLANRQPVTSVPYAIQALSANFVAATNINGPLTSAQLPTNVAFLNLNQTFSGVKTFTQPTFFSNAVSLAPGNASTPLVIQGTGINGEWIGLKGTNGVMRWHLNDTFAGLNFVQTGVADYRLFFSTNGNVGIDTSNPQSKLQVVGDIQLGAGGTNFATSSMENLRIVRGTIFDNGVTWNIFAGKGFTVAHPSAGSYTITFDRAFASVPSVTVSAVNSIARTDTVTTITTSSVKVSLINTVGSPSNDSFSFIAIGPQ